MLLPFAAGKLLVANQLLGLVQIGQGLVHGGLETAGLEEILGLLFQIIADRSQVGNSRPRGKQHVADVPLPANDVLAAGDQPRVVDAEHGLELGLVAAAQEAVQDRLFQRLLFIGREQRALVPLAANDFQLLAVVTGQRGANPQAAVVVEEVVRRVGGDAVEQVPQGPQGRALAGLVGAIDQMKALAAARQIERHVAERSEGPQIESQDLHLGPSRDTICPTSI